MFAAVLAALRALHSCAGVSFRELSRPVPTQSCVYGLLRRHACTPTLLCNSMAALLSLYLSRSATAAILRVHTSLGTREATDKATRANPAYSTHETQRVGLLLLFLL